ncbi:MAG: ATP-binding protein [Smithellaceae bacterium]|nr:ATP-binding protein [Smithellaceae bacterium]NLX51079.1 hypothetical protein [Deltaproteobacteria bacterium]
MDTFTLAATSFTIALSLFITGKTDRLHRSFAVLCLAVFLYQAAVFFRGLFAPDFWAVVATVGLPAIAPLAVRFFLHLTRHASFLTQGAVALTSVLSAAGIVAGLTPLAGQPWLGWALVAYTCVVLAVCYGALWRHVRRLEPSAEKKRLRYLLIACATAALLCSVDLLGAAGWSFPPVAGLVLSALLYFTLLVIAYPQLSELHDFFARALVIFVCTLIGAFIFYLVAYFFNIPLPSFTSVIMTSFLIVISVTPVKMILKKIFSLLYPDSKDVFTSLYEFDEKLEREKALLLAEMAPVFAHEIRNPLGSIKGAAQYLQSEAATEEQTQLLNVIIEEVNRLNAVVSQFLNYARPGSGKIVAQDINVIVAKAIAIIGANRLADRITIQQELHDALPPVRVDEQQILQVIINIALNAIEAMPDGGSLTFRTSRIETGAGPAVGILIRDTGRGIGPEELKNIFKPFYTTKERGVGLGLAISQRIIREHGGAIRAKSVPGQGSVFFIRLAAAGRN